MALIAFSVNHQRPEAVALAERTARWLEENGHRSTSIEENGHRSTSIEENGHTSTSIEENGHTSTSIGGAEGHLSLDGAELLVSLGGDGTLLRSVDAALGRGIPVLGVNIGRLGFLTQIEPAGLEDALSAFLAGTHQVEERMTLSVTVTGPDGSVTVRRIALNEATVEKTVPGHTVRVAALIDGRPFVTYAADGLLVATPTGSTAYNLSARGPVLSPRLRALVVTPVSPHMLFDRPLVLDPEERLRLEVLEPRPAVLVVDGVTVATLQPGSVVDCVEGDRPARLVTVGPRNFHAILRAKFHLSDR